MNSIKKLVFISTLVLLSSIDLSAQTTVQVFFYGKNYITKAQAIDICNKNKWQMATPAQIKEAWANLKLHQYAFGMMEDGRFAVPVQQDYSNFRRGPNIGAQGGNQGFFYIDLNKIDSKEVTTLPNNRNLYELNEFFYELNQSTLDFVNSLFPEVDRNGDIRINNRGAFTLIVETYINGQKSTEDLEFIAGNQKQYLTPPNHENAVLKGYVITGLVWEPRRLIFEVPRGRGFLKIETYGTTLNHHHQVIRR